MKSRARPRMFLVISWELKQSAFRQSDRYVLAFEFPEPLVLLGLFKTAMSFTFIGLIPQKIKFFLEILK